MDEFCVDEFKSFCKLNGLKIFYRKKNSVHKFDGNAILFWKDKFKIVAKHFLDAKIKNNEEYKIDDELS